MYVIQVLKDGATAAVRTWRGTLLLYSANVLLAGVAALVFRAGFSGVFGPSMMPEDFMQGFDYTAYSELVAHGDALMLVMTSLVFWLVLLQMVSFAFVGGGIISALAEDEATVRLRNILQGGALFAGRFLRILLIELFLLSVVGGLTAFVFGIAVATVSAQAGSEMSVIWAVVGCSLIVIIPTVLVLAVGDLARVITVARDERSVLRAVWHGIVFVFRNLLTVFALEAVLLLTAVGVVALYWLVEGRVPMDSGTTVLLMLLIQQSFIIIRMGIKTWTYGSVVSLWEIKESQHARTETASVHVPTAVLSAPATESGHPHREEQTEVRTVRRRVLKRKVPARRPRPVRRSKSSRKR